MDPDQLAHTVRAEMILGDSGVGGVPWDGWLKLESPNAWVRRSFTAEAMNAAENVWSGHADPLRPAASRLITAAAVDHDVAILAHGSGEVEVDWEAASWSHEVEGHSVKVEAPVRRRRPRNPQSDLPTTESDHAAEPWSCAPRMSGPAAGPRRHTWATGQMRATLFATLEDYHPVVASWQVERPAQGGQFADDTGETIDYCDTNEAAFDGDHLESVIDRAVGVWHTLAAQDGLAPMDGPRVRLHTTAEHDGHRGELYVSAWVQKARPGAGQVPAPSAGRRIAVSVEVPPQARPHGHFYVHEVQLKGDEDLCEGSRLEIHDKRGERLPAIVEDITRDAYGAVYRVALLRVVKVEVPAGARPDGYAYVHDAQLDGGENLEVGTRVEIHDEGGNYLPAVVDDITPHGPGRQYRLRLGR